MSCVLRAQCGQGLHCFEWVQQAQQAQHTACPRSVRSFPTAMHAAVAAVQVTLAFLFP